MRCSIPSNRIPTATFGKENLERVPAEQGKQEFALADQAKNLITKDAILDEIRRVKASNSTKKEAVEIQSHQQCGRRRQRQEASAKQEASQLMGCGFKSGSQQRLTNEKMQQYMLGESNDCKGEQSS